MARRISKRARNPDAERDAAAKALHDLVGGPRTRPKGRRSSASPGVIKKWCIEFEQLRSRSDFDGMHPRHLVAMYIIAHEWIYGVRPSEVVGKVAQGAVSACKKMMREEFDDDPVNLLRYLRHTFKKEKEREEWRRKNNQPGARLSYRDVFVYRRKLDDYRVDMARARDE